MNPNIQHMLADARTADLRGEAERRRLARLARPASGHTAARRISGPGFALGQAISALVTAGGQRRHPGAVAAAGR
jgi:hypothetical protein